MTPAAGEDPNGDEARASDNKHDRRISRAKRKHRSELGDWASQRYHEQWPAIKLKLEQQYPHARSSSVARITQAEFKSNLRKYAHQPCILTDCCTLWPAKHKWTFEYFAREHKRARVKCGEDDDGYAVKVPMRTFLHYMQTQKDDSPLYVFDSSFGGGAGAERMHLERDYQAPEVFAQDLFQHAGEKKRPPHRWFLMGPERSGSTIHIDPLQTSAWNASVVGRKLWACFSPETPRTVIKGRKYKQQDDEAIDWFVHMMPHILRDGDLPPTSKFMYFIQHAGETVHVPSGWWHVVLNLDDTLAVTQNFACDSNLPLVWRNTRVERQQLAKKWRRRLERHAPAAYRTIRQLDEEDEFVLEEDMAQRRKERRIRRRKEMMMEEE